jgi:hypothetical protein
MRGLSLAELNPRLPLRRSLEHISDFTTLSALAKKT